MKTNEQPKRPTAGAMRAVAAFFDATTKKNCNGTELAQIIDRETGVAELVAALELAKPCIEYAEIATGATGWQSIQHKKCLEALEAVSAALAKIQETLDHRPTRSTV